MGQEDVVVDLLDFGANVIFTICDVLRDLVPLVQFKKREKHPWGSVLGVFHVL